MHSPSVIFFLLCPTYDIILHIAVKLEELDEAQAYLMKKFNFTISPDYRPPRRLKNNNYMENYKNISDYQLQQLQEVYKYDIELFGFPKSPFD